MLEKRAKVTYFFQVKKCDDQSCPHHKPLRGNHTVDVFPDPVPNEVDGILHYKEGVDPTEKYLPSILENVEKSPHGIPLQPYSPYGEKRWFCYNLLRV